MYSLSDGERYLFSFLLGTSSYDLVSPMSMPSAILRTFSMTCTPYLCGFNTTPQSRPQGVAHMHTQAFIM